MTPQEQAEIVATKLLGWKHEQRAQYFGDDFEGFATQWFDRSSGLLRNTPERYLNTWQGAGEILEAMREQPEEVRAAFCKAVEIQLPEIFDECSNGWTAIYKLTPTIILEAAAEVMKDV